MPMAHHSTLNFEFAYDDALAKGIRDVFQAESENKKPSSAVLRFIKGYAAACESVESRLLGNMTVLNN